MLDLEQALALSKDMLVISLILSVGFAVICGYVASRRKLRVPFWAVMGFAFGPFALPFVFMARPTAGKKTDSPGGTS